MNENPINKKIRTEKVEIKDKMYMILYKAYQNLTPCLSGPMEYNGIIRSKLFENTNIIWKLLKRDKMFSFLQELNKYQRYNHFPMTWELSHKDNLYNNYFKLHSKFPKDYYYMPETYILPKNFDIILEKVQNLDLKNIQNLWLIKPKASCRGQGVKLLTDVKSIKREDKCIISHYIYNPHLINGKKYDLRIYLLITGYTPIKIYLFDDGLARFCSEKYDLSSYKMQDKFIHLTNYAINKKSKNFEINNSVDEELGDKWTLHTLKNHFEKNGLNYDKVWEKIKDIIVKVVLSVSDIAIPLIKKFKLSSCNLFELYGIDILLDEMLNPWLLEVNLNPSLNCDNQLELRIKSKLITDILNIIGAIPFSHDGKFIPLDKPNEYKDEIEEGVIESLCEFERPLGGFERIFPLKDNIKYYSKFLNKPGDENLALWKKILNTK